MTGRWLVRLSAGVVAALVAACGPAPSATFEDGVEQQDGPGQVVLIGDPAAATEALTIVFANAATLETFDERAVTLAAGDEIRASTFNLPGPMGVYVNGRQCTGVFEVKSDQTTTVVLRFPSSGCTVTTDSVEPISTVAPPFAETIARRS